MKARARAGIAAAILVALALPAGAGATPHYKQPASVTSEIHGSGTNGFRFILFALDRGETIFSASKGVGKVGQASVSYFEAPHHDRSRVGDGRIDVKVGRLGHFRGHFVATSTKTLKPFRGCQGEATTVEAGHFVGSFRFRGERGYTTIDAERESGSVTHTGAQTCVGAAKHESHRQPQPTKAEKEREDGEFRLVAGDSKARVFLRATREDSSRELHSTPTSYEVTARGGRVGKFSSSYSASTFSMDPDASSTFQVPNLAEPPAEATIQPPAPFSGSATFHLETPKTASWTGDLAVELPGLGEVPLTGQKISAGLCHGRSDCTATLPAVLQPLLETAAGGLVAVEDGTGKSGS